MGNVVSLFLYKCYNHFERHLIHESMSSLLLSNVVEFLNFIAHGGDVLEELRESIKQSLSHPSKFNFLLDLQTSDVQRI